MRQSSSHTARFQAQPFPIPNPAGDAHPCRQAAGASQANPSLAKSAATPFQLPAADVGAFRSRTSQGSTAVSISESHPLLTATSSDAVTVVRIMSPNPDKVSLEASRLVRQWAGPRMLGDNTKTLIWRAARRLGFTYSRTRALFYCEAAVVRAEEMDALRKRERAAAADEIEALRIRLDRLERWVSAMAGSAARAGADHQPARDAVKSSR